MVEESTDKKRNPLIETAEKLLQNKIGLEQALSDIDGFRRSITSQDILEFLKFREYVQYQYGGNTYPLNEIGYRFAKISKDEEFIASEAYNLGNSILSCGDYSDAMLSLFYFKEALDFYNKKNDKSKMSATFSSLGNAYIIMKDLEKAIKFFENALKLSKEINDKAAEGSDKFNLGSAYKLAGNKEKAISCYKESIGISKELGDFSSKAWRCFNLAHLLKEENKIDEAETYFKAANDAFVKYGDTKGEYETIIELIKLHSPFPRQMEKITEDRIKKRIEYIKLGLNLAEREKIPEFKTKCLQMLGSSYSDLKVYSLALKYLHESFEQAKEMNDMELMEPPLSKMGLIYSELGQYTKAIEVIEKLIDLENESPESRISTYIYGELGLLYYEINDFEKSIQYFEKQIEVLENPSIFDDNLLEQILGVERKRALAEHFKLIGRSYSKIQKYDKAISILEKALNINEKVRNYSEKRVCLAFIGEVNLHKGDLSKAEELFEAAISDCESQNDTKGLIHVLWTIGDIYSGLSMHKKSLKYLNQGLRLCEENELNEERLELLVRIGEIYMQTHDYEQSVGYLKNTLKQLKEGEENYLMLRRILRDLGVSYLFQGKFTDSLDYLKRATEANERLGDQEFNMEVLRYIYELSIRIGDRAQCKKSIDDILSQIDEFSDETRVGGFISAAVFYITEHDYENAYSFINKAIDLASKINSSRISEALSYKGTINRFKENVDEAIKCYEKALIEFRKANDRRNEAEVLDMLGMAYFAKGYHKKALDLIKQSISMSEEIDNIYALITTYANLGELYRLAFHNSQKAVENYKKSIQYIFSVGGYISSDDIKLKIFEKNIFPFHGIVKALIDMDDNVSALCYAENMKSRNFIEKIEKKRAYREKTDLKESKSIFTIYGLPPYAHVDKNLDSVSKEGHANHLNNLSYEFIDEKSFGSLLNKLSIDPSSANVEYFIMDDSCAIFLIYKIENSIKVSVKVINDFNVSDLFKLLIQKDADQYYGYLTAYIKWIEERDNSKENDGLNNKNFINFCNEIDKVCGVLYENIFAPLEDFLDSHNITRIMFIPNTALNLLPLHAMYKRCDNGDKRYLIEDYEISYLPSLKMLFETDQSHIEQTESMLIISNPDYTLPSADYETEKILAFYKKAMVLSHEDASFDKVISSLTNKNYYIHFSCHGKYDTRDPMNSFLVLHDIGLKLSDILNVLNLKETKLITLSACETGLVKLDATDEYLGIAGAFLISGAQSVVSSLWEVSSYSTSLLMGRFYEEIFKNNLSPEIALVKAQKWLLKELTLQDLIALLEKEINSYPDGTTKMYLKEHYKKLNEERDLSKKPFAHPYYWAAFSVSKTYELSNDLI